MAINHLPVREVMQTTPVTVRSGMRLQHAARLMVERRVDSAVVTRRDELVGMLTERDMLTKAVAENLKPSRSFVRTVMSPLVTAGPDTDLREVARLMVRLRTKTVAVVSNGELLGIVTEQDILRMSPALIDVGREHAHVHGGEEGLLQRSIDGYCENCTDFAQELQNADGRWLCADCLGTTA